MGELEAMPRDEAVFQAEEESREKQKVSVACNEWRVVPPLWKGVLMLAALLNALTVYGLAGFASMFFRSFEVTGDKHALIENGGLCERPEAGTETCGAPHFTGSYWNIVVNPQGWILIGMFAAGFVLYTAFSCSASYRVRSRPADFKIPAHVERRFNGNDADFGLDEDENDGNVPLENI